MGIDITLLSTDKGLAPDDADMSDICDLVTVRSMPPRSLNFAPGTIPQLRSLLPTVDAVHIHSVNTFTSSAAMNMSRWSRVPYVLEPHGALDRYHLRQGMLKKKLYNGVIDRWAYKGVERAIYSSSREHEEGSGTVSAPGIVMPLGVDERLFAVERKRSRVPRVLFLGRIAHKKRVDLVIRAMATPLLRESEAILTVAGPLGDDLSYDPRQLARQLGVEDRVNFVGRIDGDQRLSILGESDVFVLASEDESFGVAVAEAMAAGCAVVASAEVGLVTDAVGKNALIPTDLSVEGVTAALVSAIGDSGVLGRRAQSYALDNFRWAKAAAQLAETYEILAGARVRRA